MFIFNKKLKKSKEYVGINAKLLNTKNTQVLVIFSRNYINDAHLFIYFGKTFQCEGISEFICEC